MTFPELLKILFAENGFNPTSFADQYGGSDVTYRDIIEGRTSKATFKIKSRIERAFGIKFTNDDFENVEFTKVEKLSQENRQDEKSKQLPISASLEQNFTYAKVKFYKVIKSVNAGDPMFIYSDENDTGEVAGFEYEKTERCFSLKVKGDSMQSPTGNGKTLKEGDKVLIDMDAQILPGDVVVVSLVNGRELIKQYQLADDDNFVKLHSFNSLYPDIIVRTSDINVMYRVVGKSSLEAW